MKSKLITYAFKAIFFIFAWYIIVTSCTGNINVNLFCVSVLTYTGSIVFDIIFYLLDSSNVVSKLKKAIRFIGSISLISNLIIVMLVLLMNSYITIPYDETQKMYNIMLINVNNGFFTLYPELAAKMQILLNDFMTWVGVSALSSLIPAVFLEIDFYNRIKNEQNINNKQIKTEKVR